LQANHQGCVWLLADVMRRVDGLELIRCCSGEEGQVGIGLDVASRAPVSHCAHAHVAQALLVAVIRVVYALPRAPDLDLDLGRSPVGDREVDCSL
jgi:hypothetical protein